MPDFNVYVMGVPGSKERQPVRVLFNEARKYQDGEVRLREILHKVMKLTRPSLFGTPAIDAVRLNPDDATFTADTQPDKIVVPRHLSPEFARILSHMFELSPGAGYVHDNYGLMQPQLEFSFGPKMKVDGGRRRKTRKNTRRRRTTRRR